MPNIVDALLQGVASAASGMTASIAENPMPWVYIAAGLLALFVIGRVTGRRRRS